MFTDVFEAPGLDQGAVSRHFDPEYVQSVDGRTLTHGDFIEHLRALKREVRRTVITVEHLVAEGDAVCSVHTVAAEKHDGGSVEGRVIAYWRFDAGRIARCEELTHMISGSPADRNLGSRS